MKSELTIALGICLGINAMVWLLIFVLRHQLLQ